MHSPLLKESLWVSHPPPTYMLKFSGLAGLSSCFERWRQTMPLNVELVKALSTTRQQRHINPQSQVNLTSRQAINCMCQRQKAPLTHKACSSQAWLSHGSLLMIESRRWSRQAFRNTPKAQCAFKSLLIHEILLFSMLITLCCTLHHHPSQDIQCWKLWWHKG